MERRKFYFLKSLSSFLFLNFYLRHVNKYCILSISLHFLLGNSSISNIYLSAFNDPNNSSYELIALLFLLEMSRLKGLFILSLKYSLHFPLNYFASIIYLYIDFGISGYVRVLYSFSFQHFSQIMESHSYLHFCQDSGASPEKLYHPTLELLIRLQSPHWPTLDSYLLSFPSRGNHPSLAWLRF
jgi:hypothetical protein